MNKYSYEADQEYACLNDAGMTKGVATCKWTKCANVGYCIDERDFDYFDEISAWNEEQEDVQEDGGWGSPKTPKPTSPPKTPRPTTWTAPKTPKPTSPPKTPRPTKNVTPRPTKGEKTPR